MTPLYYTILNLFPDQRYRTKLPIHTHSATEELVLDIKQKAKNIIQGQLK